MDSFSNTKMLQSFLEILWKPKFLGLESEPVVCVWYLGIFPSHSEFDAGGLGKKNKATNREFYKPQSVDLN